jgi:hypothetical protein
METGVLPQGAIFLSKNPAKVFAPFITAAAQLQLINKNTLKILWRLPVKGGKVVIRKNTFLCLNGNAMEVQQPVRQLQFVVVRSCAEMPV